MSERKKGARFRSTWLSLPLQACKETGEMTDAIMRLISVDYSRVNSLTFQFCFFHNRRNEISDLLVFNVACALHDLCASHNCRCTGVLNTTLKQKWNTTTLLNLVPRLSTWRYPQLQLGRLQISISTCSGAGARARRFDLPSWPQQEISLQTSLFCDIVLPSFSWSSLMSTTWNIAQTKSPLRVCFVSVLF